MGQKSRGGTLSRDERSTDGLPLGLKEGGNGQKAQTCQIVKHAREKKKGRGGTQRLPILWEKGTLEKKKMRRKKKKWQTRGGGNTKKGGANWGADVGTTLA